MGTFPPRARFEAAVSAGNALLERHGFPQRGTAAELEAWLRTDTPYPNPDPGDLLDSPCLVVHEIVEIEAVKRRGLRITKDVIVRNMVVVNDAHLEAAEVELRVAAVGGHRDYVQDRFADLAAWCADPELTATQRLAYERFRDRVAAWLRTADQGAGTEDL